MNLKTFFKQNKQALVQRLTSDTEIIEQIHNEFDRASENALKAAQEILSNSTSVAREKGQLMAKLGFQNTAEAKRIDDVIYNEQKAKERAEIVDKYQQKYPQYKFIFWDQVESICGKYNLVCGQSSLYKGDIPLKNLKEIENFEVKEEDIFYINKRYWNSDIERLTKAEASFDLEYRRDIPNTKAPFFICAPIKDMDTTNMKMEGVFLQREIPDPIVLHPMKEGALIVSKWGLEGEDPALTNEKMN